MGLLSARDKFFFIGREPIGKALLVETVKIPGFFPFKNIHPQRKGWFHAENYYLLAICSLSER